MFEWNLLTILALISACFSLYVLCHSMFQGPAKGLGHRMEDFAKQAVETAQSEHDIILNYSLESIAILDSILEKIHQRHQESAIPERELSRIVLTWGGYLGIALQKQFGGSWQANSSIAGKNTYPLRCQNREAVPVMWCLQRIRRGAAASIVTKSNEFVGALDAKHVNS